MAGVTYQDLSGWQEGQVQRCLQEKATNISWWQSPQRTRAANYSNSLGRKAADQRDTGKEDSEAEEEGQAMKTSYKKPRIDPAYPYIRKSGGTPKQLKELIASAGGTVRQFPTDAFPSPLARYIRRIAKALPCPEDFPGVMMLATLGAAVGRKRCIQLKKGWTEYPLLWTAIVARSGDRKSPAFDKIMEPVMEQHKLLRKRHIEEVDAWKSSEDKADTPKPVLTQIVTTDSTVEALKDVLETSRNGVLFAAYELSGWVRSTGQYKRGGGADRQEWLSIWEGEPIVCRRRCQEPIDIPEPFVSVVGGIRPDALEDIIDVRREDGFAARVLFAYPQRIPRKQWTKDSVGNSAEYSGIWKQLYELPGNKEIPLSKAAEAVWAKWVNEHRENEPPDILRSAWGKAEGHCARFALILHLCRVACNQATERKIGREAMEGAVKLIEYFLSHAAKVYRSSAVKRDKRKLWLAGNRRSDTLGTKESPRCQ